VDRAADTDTTAIATRPEASKTSSALRPFTLQSICMSGSAHGSFPNTGPGERRRAAAVGPGSRHWRKANRDAVEEGDEFSCR
jgi:hypothetical protein